MLDIQGECTAQPGAKFASTEEPNATVDHGYEAGILYIS